MDTGDQERVEPLDGDNRQPAVSWQHLTRREEHLATWPPGHLVIIQTTQCPHTSGVRSVSDRLLRTVIISSAPSPGWHETVRPSSAAAEAIMVPAIGPRISATWSLGLAWALVAASRGGSHSSALSFILPSSAQAASSAYSRRARFWSKLNIDYQHQPSTSTSTSTSVQAADRLETDESSAGVTRRRHCHW